MSAESGVFINACLLIDLLATHRLRLKSHILINLKHLYLKQITPVIRIAQQYGRWLFMCHSTKQNHYTSISMRQKTIDGFESKSLILRSIKCSALFDSPLPIDLFLALQFFNCDESVQITSTIRIARIMIIIIIHTKNFKLKRKS